MSPKFRSEILQESKIFRSSNKAEVPEDLFRLGTSFSKASWYTELDPSMKTLVEVLRRLTIYFEVAQREPCTVMPTDNDLFLVYEHQLLSARYSEETDDLHETLRLSLLIYLNLRIWHFQTFPLMQYMVEALKQSLALRLPHFQAVAPDLSFWILFIGGMASQGYKSHPWFVCRLSEMTHRLGLEEWSKARSVLAGFFYTEQPAERGAENLWSEVLLSDSCKFLLAAAGWFEAIH
jgi:hypothetical protein